MVDSMPERRHYLCKFRLDGHDRHVLWFTNARDGLLLDQESRLCAFNTPELALAHAGEQGLQVVIEPVPIYDFDGIASWCRQPRLVDIDCVRFLDAWNMFADLAASLGARAGFTPVGKRLDRIYSKLFHGCNLPAMTPPGCSYEPLWSAAEAKALARLFDQGLRDLHLAMP